MHCPCRASRQHSGVVRRGFGTTVISTRAAETAGSENSGGDRGLQRQQRQLTTRRTTAAHRRGRRVRRPAQLTTPPPPPRPLHNHNHNHPYLHHQEDQRVVVLAHIHLYFQRQGEQRGGARTHPPLLPTTGRSASGGTRAAGSSANVQPPTMRHLTSGYFFCLRDFFASAAGARWDWKRRWGRNGASKRLVASGQNQGGTW